MIAVKKKGQVAIFVIVAIVIVALILLFFLFRPEIERLFEGELTPLSYLTKCIEPDVKSSIELLSKQGGYKEPEGYITYQGEKIKYLCYTNNYYETCVVQQPMIKQQFENELNSMLKTKANQCTRNLIEEYKSRGYNVEAGKIDSDVSIISGKIIVTFNLPLTLTKEETKRTFQKFNVEMNTDIYDLLFIASSIIEYEASLGDSASELYMQYYPDLRIEKIKLSDGAKIYKLSNIKGDKFIFASRSLAWPAGYGLEEGIT